MICVLRCYFVHTSSSICTQAKAMPENKNSRALSPVFVSAGGAVGGVEVVICSLRGIQDVAGARPS